MSLSDLRKKPAPFKPLEVNIDEFIENAKHYRLGNDNIVQLHPEKAQGQEKTHQPFRRATFTLSEPCIEALTQLSKETGMSKSHIIRMLIRQLEQAHPVTRQLMIDKHA